MNRKALTLVAALTFPALSLAGCRGAARELAEATVAEALVTQSISTYNEAAVSVSVNDRSVSMGCNTGGTVDWSELSSDAEEVCYEVDSRGCEFETGSGRSFSIEGTSEMCGSDDFALKEEALVAGQTFSLAGTSTVTTSQGSRTCEYALDVVIDSVLSDGATYDVTVSGSLCGQRAYSASFSLAVAGNVDVDAEG